MFSGMMDRQEGRAQWLHRAGRAGPRVHAQVLDRGGEQSLDAL